MALKASPEDQALLLELQAVDTKLSQIVYRAKNVPEHIALQKIGIENLALQAELTEQRGAVEDVRTELKRIESDVSIVETRIKRDRERLQVSSSTKDVAALEQELAALTKRQFDLEEIELTVMERLDETESVVAGTSEKVAALQARVTDLESARDAAMHTIDAEHANADANRSAIVGKVPEDLLALYEKQRARYGTGASLLRGGVSLASGLALNSADMVVVRAAAPDDVILCPESSAILVRTNESGL
jgi:predicted  nucleic acid-binding Zn-ribbon protein